MNTFTREWCQNGEHLSIVIELKLDFGGVVFGKRRNIYLRNRNLSNYCLLKGLGENCLSKTDVDDLKLPGLFKNNFKWHSFAISKV